ncbi:MAG: N-acyl homoserine lactonase family protein [Bacteroidota bacterium]
MIVSKTFENGIKVHGFRTGTVAVTPEHYAYSGLGLLRIPQILFSRRFLDDMPIWVWVIETRHGNYLIDTGESIRFYEDDHFGDKRDAFVNRRILRIKIQEKEQINYQLKKVGLSPEQMDAVILTHLHIDHTDGIGFFPEQEFFVSRLEWEKPVGAPFSTFPSGFKPSQILHEKTALPFAGAYQFSEEITLLSTPGHTFGHQSVLLNVGSHMIMFAGDATFSEAQMLRGEIGGISISPRQARETVSKIQAFSQEVELIYLPSHDPESGLRLQKLQASRFLG